MIQEAVTDYKIENRDSTNPRNSNINKITQKAIDVFRKCNSFPSGTKISKGKRTSVHGNLEI